MPLRRLLILLAALILPAAAQAHAILEESAPPAGATVKAGALDLTLRFNSRIDHGRSRLTLIRGDKTRDTVAITANTAADIVAGHVDLAPGTYIIRWQVLAVDGHITRGDIPLTVAAP